MFVAREKELKLLRDIMSKNEMEKETEKIRAIKGINVGQIGFVSVMGFEEYENNYMCISGRELYG